MSLKSSLALWSGSVVARSPKNSANAAATRSVHVWVVVGDRELVVQLELGVLRRPGCLALRGDDALDRGQHRVAASACCSCGCSAG